MVAIMLATDDELRFEIGCAATMNDEYREMVAALAVRDANHAAMEHIAGQRWSEIRTVHTAQFDDTPTM